MENYAYAASYPDSGHSSPRSREIDFENTAAWDEQSPAPNYKVKFMCSYGGKIHPRPHDNQLAYVGGETKILVVDRSIKFAALIAKLSALCDADVCFKYQLPGEDLDALISVANDDDLEHTMHEYDRLCRGSSKPARLRLFLFLVNQPSVTPSGSFGSSEGRGERERLVEVLNSVPVQAVPPPPAVVPSPSNNVDFLFGLEKGMQQQQPVPVRVQVPDPDISGRVVPEDPIQRHIQDLKRLQIGGQEQAMNRRRSDDNLAGGFNGEYYAQKVPEKLPPATIPANVSAPGPGGVYQQTVPGPEQAVYMIQGPAGVYHAQAGRVPVTGPTGQGYYAVQRMPPEVYRDQQPAYNFVTQVGAPPVTALGQPTMPPQRVAGFSEGFGMLRQTTTGGVGVVDTGYTQVAYDGGMGRQVYYNAQGGAVPPPYQADMRGAGTTSNQDGKVMKVTQGSV